MQQKGFKKIISDLQSVPGFWFVLLWSVVEICLIWFYQNTVTTRESAEQVLGQELSPVQIDLYLSVIREISYTFYLALPLILLVRIFLISLLLHLFLILNRIRMSIKQIFHINCVAFLAVVLKDVAKHLSVFLSQDNQTQEVLKTPFSLAFLLQSTEYTYLHRLLNEINLFEVFWMVIVIVLLRQWRTLTLKQTLVPVLGTRWLAVVFLWGAGVFYEIYFL